MDLYFLKDMNKNPQPDMHYHCEFFILALAGDIFLESDRQQVSSGIQVSSQHSVELNNAVGLDSLDSSSDSNSSSLLSKSLWTVPSTLTTNDINVTHIINSFFGSLARFKYSISRFAFFYFYSMVHQDVKIHKTANSYFFLANQNVVWSSGWDLVIRLYL